MKAELETELVLLKSDVARVTSLFEKLDVAIEKMGDVMNSVGRMLAVHEERLNKQDDLDEELFTLIEKRRQEMQNDIKDLHSRITTVSRELADDINETEQRLMTAMTYGISDLKKCIMEENKALLQERKDLEKRVVALENWRWLVIGGAIVATSLIHSLMDFLIK